ncbi:nuclear RNA export factor 1-like [Panulirus ornatus]|uniref:nuclear RNA export factor 1-like n=1 Tax=Panulirus ornatus TaxID=150431 RepID=UPI003A88FEE5
MGKKSRHRLRKKGKGDFFVDDEVMTVDLDEAYKPKNAKDTSKLNRKRMKKLRKEQKQQELMEKHREKNEKKKRTSWHVVTVRGGSGIDKNFLFSSIGNFMETEFQPFGFHKIDDKVCFYLEENEPAASAISGLSKRVQGPDGTRLKISVEKCGVPDLVLNSDQLLVLREVMSNRFNPSACLLDLTNLHHDPVLLEKDILAPLSAPTVTKQIVRLIRENIPHLKALNLSKNNLSFANMKVLQALHVGSSHLTALNLDHNNIGNIGVIKFFKMFHLTELSLQFNPCVNSYKVNPLKYMRHVKRELEQLKMLDGVDINAYLAKNMKTKIESQQSVSKLDGSISCSSNNSCKVSEPLVRTFLEQYYSLIDTQQRVNLVAAYTPDAVLEVKSSISSIASSVFVGHSLISKVLATLPATQHQHSTFSLDIQSLSIDTAKVVVTGQCQIAGVDTMATFSHSMTIVPFNAGLCCSWDVLELR